MPGCVECEAVARVNHIPAAASDPQIKRPLITLVSFNGPPPVLVAAYKSVGVGQSANDLDERVLALAVRHALGHGFRNAHASGK